MQNQHTSNITIYLYINIASVYELGGMCIDSKNFAKWIKSGTEPVSWSYLSDWELENQITEAKKIDWNEDNINEIGYLIVL